MVRNDYKSGLFRFLCAVCLLFISSITYSQLITIQLKSGSVAAHKNVDSWKSKSSTKAAIGYPARILVTFDHLLNEQEKNSLTNNGVLIYDYIPDNTYEVLIKNDAAWNSVISNSATWSVTEVKSAWITDSYFAEAKTKGTQEIDVLVSLYERDKQLITQFLSRLGATVLPYHMEQYGLYKMRINRAKVEQLASWFNVRYITPFFEDSPLDRNSVPTVRGNNAGQVSPVGYGLTGRGVTIGVGDNTSGIFHSDTKDRIVNFNPAPMTNHGIHINGIAGGAAILDPKAVSMTPEVKLLNYFFSTVLSATGEMYRNYNMTITNNSYTVVENACSYFGTYDLYSRFIDTLAIQYPAVQHVFAAGNDGELTCGTTPAGYRTVGGGYQPSKNTLIVGSVSRTMEQAFDQSRGPVKDGRIKPEIVAVGVDVYSGLRNNTYGEAGGTSMAAPQAASGLAILTERFKQKYSYQPIGALLRSMIIGGATDLGTPGPDYSYGFGIMNVKQSLEIIDKGNFDSGIVNTGSSKTRTINVPVNTKQLKVTICWNDVPASPLSAKQLINDIDIVLISNTGTRYLPMILNPLAGKEQEPSQQGMDRLNNVEQIIVNDIPAGDYTLEVKGHSIPVGPQSYYLSWHTKSSLVELTYPIENERVINNDSLRVHWDDIADGGTYKLQFSSDGGQNWTDIKNDIVAIAKYYSFIPGNVNSGRCKVRLTKNNSAQTVTSGQFVVSTQPVIKLSDDQCPGYINTHWSPVPRATKYYMYSKVGTQIAVVDSTTDTTYSYSNMSTNDWNYVAVAPVIDGAVGYRSVSVITIANTGNCNSATSIGDLAIERLSSPKNSRLLSSLATSGSSISVKIKNLYQTAANAQVYARVNGGEWKNSAVVNIADRSDIVVNVPGFNFDTAGSYSITCYVKNLSTTDVNQKNDTLTAIVRILPNPPLTLDTVFSDGFEIDSAFTIRGTSIGITQNGYWDFESKNDSGRIRSKVSDEVSISGKRSMSMDQFMPMKNGSNNKLIGSFNLAQYKWAESELRFDIDYLVHSKPKDVQGNNVYFRAQDSDDWTYAGQYDFGGFPGTKKTLRSLSLSDACKITGKDFSSTTQIAFGQNDTTLIGGVNYGTGISFDNFRLYMVQDDAMLSEIISPSPTSCGMPEQVPLVIKVKNGVNKTIKNVHLFYSLNAGPVVSELIDSIKSKDSVLYTFSTLLAINQQAFNKLSVWISQDNDSYRLNDSILNYEFINSKIVDQYPYYEDFETNQGGYYSTGYLNSWAYGTPKSTLINAAASGSKAWKTNLTGVHNAFEQSYLYTPCFSLKGLLNPTLSFAMALDIENCGTIMCDEAYMEYSLNDGEWKKLGNANSGTNWYDANHNSWTTSGFTRWHVATIPIPRETNNDVIRFRYVLQSDPAVNMEGIAIDNVHVYDLTYPIYNVEDSIRTTTTAQPNKWTTSLVNSSLINEIKHNTSSIAASALYKQTVGSNTGQTQKYMPRSYTINNNISDDCTLRLYLTDEDFDKFYNDSTCNSCTKPNNVWQLGTTIYSSNKLNTVNDRLTDDTAGEFRFVPAANIDWKPYANGYRAEIHMDVLGEIWFNDGGPLQNMPVNADYVSFSGYRIDNNKIRTFWQSKIDTSVGAYILERSLNGQTFESIGTIDAQKLETGIYNFIDSSAIVSNSDSIYYRLRFNINQNGLTHYSPTRLVTLADSVGALVTLSTEQSATSTLVSVWKSMIYPIVIDYQLQRSSDGFNYSNIAKMMPTGSNNETFTYIDKLRSIDNGATILYRVATTLSTGEIIYSNITTNRLVTKPDLLSIYPNPSTNGVLNINWFADPASYCRFELRTVTGVLVDGIEVNTEMWNNKLTWPTKANHKGVYLLTMYAAGVKKTMKVVIQ